jgi:Flp pilus assembly protein TadD
MLWDIPIETAYLPVIVTLLRKATVLHPYAVKNWQTLASQLLRTGEVQEAITVLTKAVSKLPAEPALHLMLAYAHYRARRSDLAQETLHQAPPVPSDDRELNIFRLELVMKTRAMKDVAQVATEMLALDPTNRDALAALEVISREKRNPEIMIPVCQAALKLEPGHTRARYQLAVANAMLGRPEEARQLIDLHQFVAVTEVATPLGYVNAEAFEAAIAGEITRNPTLKLDPIDTATRGGFQTSLFPQPGDRATVILLSLIRSAIDAFEASLPTGLDHPFVEKRPKRARLESWAVVYPSDGRQTSHIHPDGWLSGVYYVSAPKTSCDDQRSGCLVLGALDLKGLSVDPPWGTRDVHPAPGRLILFPSYIPHAVIPTQSADARICIAFDVVPSRLHRTLGYTVEAE